MSEISWLLTRSHWGPYLWANREVGHLRDRAILTQNPLFRIWSEVGFRVNTDIHEALDEL